MLYTFNHFSYGVDIEGYRKNIYANSKCKYSLISSFKFLQQDQPVIIGDAEGPTDVICIDTELPASGANNSDTAVHAVAARSSTVVTIESPSASRPAVAQVSLSTAPNPPCPLDNLLSMFIGKLTAKQVMATYRASGGNFDASVDCLLRGPTLGSLLRLLNERYQDQPTVKMQVDADNIWQDAVMFYKSPRIDMSKQLRVSLLHQPALDTGGVRRLIYTTVFDDFLSNKHVKLFDGPKQASLHS